MRFPSLEEVIACNEAVREPDEVSPTADDDDLERVARALERARPVSDAVDAAAALVFELTSFKRGSEILGEETLNLGFYRRPVMDRILGEAGFEFEGIDDDRQFFVYSTHHEPETTSV